MLNFVLLALLVDPGVRREIAQTGQARVIVELRGATAPPKGFMVTHRWRSVAGFAGEMNASALAELEGDPMVGAITLDLPGGGGLAQSVPLIGGNLVRAMGHTGSGVTVAILDSGITAAHPDLAGSVVGEHCFCRNGDGSECCPNGQTEQDGTGAAADDHGHGTAVAGVLAGRGNVASFGVAPGAKIVAVKVLDRLNRFLTLSQIVSGLDWLITNHPEIRVVNMSLLTDAHFAGACDSSFGTMRQAIETLKNRGVAVFACSGNTSSSSSMGSPACISSTIAVGAVYDDDVGSTSCASSTAADQIACFSDSDATLDLLAPGSIIRTSTLNNGAISTSGTSFASPHAAGAAAVLIGIAPTLTAAQVETYLEATGKKLLDNRNGVTTPRVDVYAAVQALLTKPPARRRAASSH